MIELRWLHQEAAPKRLQYRFMFPVNPNVQTWSAWLEVKDEFVPLTQHQPEEDEGNG